MKEYVFILMHSSDVTLIPIAHEDFLAHKISMPMIVKFMYVGETAICIFLKAGWSTIDDSLFTNNPFRKKVFVIRFGVSISSFAVSQKRVEGKSGANCLCSVSISFLSKKSCLRSA